MPPPDPEPVSLATALREIVRPRPAWIWLLQAIVLLPPLLWWVRGMRQHPGEPLSVQALYLPGGDPQYLPLVAGLSRLNLGESTLLEHQGQGVMNIPPVGLLPHAVFFGLLGPAGIMVADLVMSLAYFVALTLFLRVMGFSLDLARAVGVLAATRVLPILWGASLRLEDLASGGALVLWGERFPRPLVAEIPLVMTCAALVVLLRNGRSSAPGHWCFAGASLALLVQVDVHAGLVLGLVTALVAGGAAWEYRRTLPALLRGWGWLAGAGLVCLVPLFWQQLSSHPDVAARLGLFTLPPGKVLTTSFDPVRLGVLLALGAGAAALLPAIDPAFSRTRCRHVVALLLLCALVSYHAVPLVTGVWGRGLQLHHFRDRWVRLSSYALLVLVLFVLVALGALWRKVRARVPGVIAASLRRLAGPMLCVWAGLVWLRVDWLRAPHQVEGHARPDFAAYGRLPPTYRKEFAALARELSSEGYRSARVLGTLDHQVFVWWTAFAGKFAYASDPFVSTVSDDENERRLLSLLKLLRASPEAAGDYLAEESIAVFFLAHNKYQASGAHTFAPLSQYAGEVQRQIRAGDALSSWPIRVPPGERQRLISRYRALPAPLPEFALPDIIVLTAGQTEGLAPDEAQYERTFSSGLFTVWRRRALAVGSGVGSGRSGHLAGRV